MGRFAFSHPLSALPLLLLSLNNPSLSPPVSKPVTPPAPIPVIRLLSLTLNPDTYLVMFSSSEKLRWISALAPPRGELDLLECPDAPQVQCIKTYKARENDELALEKADIIMVMQYSNDGWMEGVKLSDRERGWFPSEHVELISSKHARQKNLKEEQRVKNAKQQVFCKK